MNFYIFIMSLPNLKIKKEVVTKNGKRFVLIPEDKYNSLIETMYLLSSPKNKRQLQESLNEPIENCEDFDDVINELES